MSQNLRPRIVSLAYHPTDINVLLPVYINILNEGEFDLSILAGTQRVFQTLDNFDIRYTNDLEVFFDHFNDEATSLVLLAADLKNAVAHMMGVWACFIARERGVPSLSVQHGLFLSKRGAANYGSFAADKMAVWGTWFRDLILSETGVKPEQLVVTGNPYFDDLPTFDKRSFRKKITDAYGISEDRPEILLAIAGHSLIRTHKVSPDEVVKFIANILKSCPRESIVFIKPHPAEAIQGTDIVYKEAASLVGRDVVLLPAEIDIRLFIIASDLVISQMSTVMAEAHLCQTPVINLIQSEFMRVHEAFADIEGIFFLETGFSGFEEELRKEIDKALDFKFVHLQEHLLSDVYNYARSGLAAKYVYSHINEIIKNSKLPVI